MYEYRAKLMPVLLMAIAFLTLAAHPVAQAQTSRPNLAMASEKGSQSVQMWEAPIDGPPKTDVRLQGSGFDPLTAIDIYFDSTVLASTTTDAGGAFGSGVISLSGPALTNLQVPADTAPGEHTITAQERLGQKSAQKSFLVTTDWTKFGYDLQHTATNPYENILSTATVGSLTLRWSYDTPGGIFFSSPAIANGKLYVGTGDNNLYALNADTGALLWKYSVGNYVDSSPAVANGIVYFGTYYSDLNLYALDATTGALIWTYPTQSRTSSPAVANGTLYVGSEDGSFYALNATTGALVWKAVISQYVQINSSPAVANGGVYFGTSDGYVYALDAATGTLLWKHQMGQGIFSSPAVANGVVYIGGGGIYGGDLVALDAGTGTQLWTFSTQGDGIASSPAVANGIVYFGANYGNVWAVNATTGILVWRYATGDIVVSSPAVANGVVYIGSEDNSVYALDAGSGALLWSYATQNQVISSPVVVNGKLYVGSEDGNMYAFGLPSMQEEGKSSPAHRP
ncbi:MAG: PQQ-binding-like beta-propeller repeat protein [Candidatus Korobacteraceae bacterium]